MESDLFVFFNAPSTTQISTLSLHDALPISVFVVICSLAVLGVRPGLAAFAIVCALLAAAGGGLAASLPARDRKSTRLNSSHPSISYAVFCLKKKTQA